MNKILKLFTNIILFVFLLLIFVLPLFSIGIMKLQGNQNVLGIQDQDINSKLIRRIRQLELENKILKEKLQSLETNVTEYIP